MRRYTALQSIPVLFMKTCICFAPYLCLQLSYNAYAVQMLKVQGVSEDLQRRFPDAAVEKASKATLQSLLDQHDLLGQDLERELSSLMLLRQYALSLLHDVEVPSPTSEQDELPGLKEIRSVQDQMER